MRENGISGQPLSSTCANFGGPSSEQFLSLTVSTGAGCVVAYKLLLLVMHLCRPATYCGPDRTTQPARLIAGCLDGEWCHAENGSVGVLSFTRRLGGEYAPTQRPILPKRLPV